MNIAFDVGVHLVTLEVTDDDGAADTDTVTITVLPPAGADTVHIADIDARVRAECPDRGRSRIQLNPERATLI